jgi:hypothetical protein
LSYSIGFGLPDNTPDLFTQIPAEVDSTRGQLPDLERRHRRARAEDRIPCAKDTGLTNHAGAPDLVRRRRAHL